MLFDNSKRTKELEEYEQRKILEKKLYKFKHIYVLNFIANKGINLQYFLNSNFYYSENRCYLIESIYEKLHWYDFVNDVFNKNNNCIDYYQLKEENKHITDLDKVSIYFDNNVLLISDGKVSYKYEVNEHGIIIINGKLLDNNKESRVKSLLSKKN